MRLALEVIVLPKTSLTAQTLSPAGRHQDEYCAIRSNLKQEITGLLIQAVY
jgi:hypothetical protein